MIRRIEFKNFKALRDTSIRLGRVNLIVGPNGSGKSTFLQSLRALHKPSQFDFDRLLSVGSQGNPSLFWEFETSEPFTARVVWRRGEAAQIQEDARGVPPEVVGRIREGRHRIRTYAFDGDVLAQPVQLQAGLEFGPKGEGLVAVLDALRDSHPERFDALNRELMHWIPEVDRVQFETLGTGVRALLLRARGHGPVRASELSHGTLFVVAMLTLAYAPIPPPVVGIEEPDHGVHPRLLRRVRDAIDRLAYPEQFGEQREAVQVVATTHSPFLLDLFRDHPEEIVIAEKSGVFSTLRRLADYPDIDEILGNAPLGDLWYSGALGGVPAES